jgi:hypothetical protein
MADVSYKGVSNKEPRVSVSGIPQSQYESTPGVTGQPTDSGGGVGGYIKQHWPMITVVLAIITIVVIIWVNNNNSTSTGTSGTGTDTGTGISSDMGSQLDADMQQLMSFQNQTNGFLQTIVNNQKSPTSSLPSNSPALNMPAHGRLISVTSPNTTLNSIMKYAGFKSVGDVYNYGNNAEIFANEGITTGNPNKKIPVGTIYAI